MKIYSYLKKKNDAFALTSIERILFPYICVIHFSKVLKEHPGLSLPPKFNALINELNL